MPIMPDGFRISIKNAERPGLKISVFSLCNECKIGKCDGACKKIDVLKSNYPDSKWTSDIRYSKGDIGFENSYDLLCAVNHLSGKPGPDSKLAGNKEFNKSDIGFENSYDLLCAVHALLDKAIQR